MPHYRIARTLKNRWQIRLEMVTWDSQFTTTPTELNDVVLSELGEWKTEFDTLPYGLMSPMTLDFTLIYSMLPSQMKTYLEQGGGTHGGYSTARNCWYLFTDRGTNGSTWTLEFVGVEDNIEALELERIEGGQFSYSVELVDAAYYWMKITNAGSYFHQPSVSGSVSSGQRSVFQVYLTSPNDNRSQEFEFWSLGASGVMYSLDGVLKLYNTASQSFSAISRSTVAGIFDHGQNLASLMTHAVEYYRVNSTTSLPRNAGAVLPASEIFVVGKIEKGSETIGGVFSKTDKFALANPTTSIYDVLRSLCEQSGVRVGYRFERVGTGPTTAIRVLFDVKLITQSRDYAKNLATPDQTLSLDNSVSYSGVTVRGDNILKAETRFETTSDKDATQIVKIQNGARASRSFNFTPLLINMPVDVQDNNPDKTWPKFKAPMRQTNQLFANTLVGSTLGAFVKVHEKTKVIWGAGVSENVVVDPDALKNPVRATDYSTNGATQTTYLLQINDAQVNGCITAALTTALLTVFSNEKNAILEVTWIISSNTKVLPDYITGRFTLTGTMTTTFSQLNWSRAIPLSISADLMSNEVTHKYLLVK